MARAPSYPPRSVVRRVLTRAARIHDAGRPHEAWAVIADAGMAKEYPTFLREGLRYARRRYQVAMMVASASRTQ